MKPLCFLLLAAALCSAPLFAQEPVTPRVLLTGLDTPWEILWGPDNWIWMTERGGRVSRVNPATGEHDVVAVIDDVVETGEAGMLGMAVNREGDITRVYLVYTYRDGQGVLLERLNRYDYDGTTLINEQELLSGIDAAGIHNGSRLVIVDDKLFMTTGDAGNMDSPQDHTSINGKMLRLNLDGTAPQDNPWAGATYPTNLLWTTGHRNAQGLFHAPNGILYSSEHGPNTNDEINIIGRARNYGWPDVHGYCDQPHELQFCSDSNVAEPIYAWTPTIAVAGLEYYDHPAIPQWRNSLLVVTLAQQDLRRLTLNEEGDSIVAEEVLFNNRWGRLRDICVAPDGRVFLATSNRDGRGSPVDEDDRIIELRATASIEPSVGPPMLDDSIFCSGELTTVRFTTEGFFEPDNVFTIQQSTDSGTFGPVRSLGSLDDSIGGEVEVRLTGSGSRYRLRVVASNPPDTSEISEFPITINSPPQIQISAASDTLCGNRDSTFLSATVDAGDADVVAIVWSTGDSGVFSVVRVPGIYFATVYDANGCSTVSGSVTIFAGLVPEVSLDPEKRAICEGDSLVLEAIATNARSYRWSTGEEGRSIMIRDSGTYWVEGTSEHGCVTRSEEVSILVLPYPAKPTVTRNGDTLTSSAGEFYQWYKDGTALLNGRDRSFVVTADGFYVVGVSNEAGCETLSDPVEIRSSGVEIARTGEDALLVSIVPHPVRDRLTIEFRRALRGRYTLRLTDIGGSEVFTSAGMGEGESRLELEIGALPAGAYVLAIDTEAGRAIRTIVKQ